MSRISTIALAVTLTAIILGAACGKPKAAPPPRRPTPTDDLMPLTDQRSDCEPRDPTQELPPVPYEERSVDEAENLANQGTGSLRRSSTRGLDASERERLITDGVDRLITALLADPYNVKATYGLAAAYARVGRAQCSVNLLGRLVLLRRHYSQRAKVEAALDRLLGRGDYKGDLDPDFFDLRDDPRFRELVKEFDPGANR